MENIRNIIESLLFVSDAPLSVDKLKTVLETVDAKEIRNNLNSLADQYEARGGGFRLCEVAGGWQLRSRPEFHEYIKRLLQPPPQRLSRAALETLAIVAYNQPIIRADIEHIRGVDCGSMLRQLLERKLIRVLGRKEIPGRPLIYATAKLFLELFELKNLKDLPTPKEIEEMGASETDMPASATPSDSKAISANSPIPPSTPQQIPGAISAAPYLSAQRAPQPKTASGFKSCGAASSRSAGQAQFSKAPYKLSGPPSSISPAKHGISGKNSAKIKQTNLSNHRIITDKKCRATPPGCGAENPKKP